MGGWPEEFMEAFDSLAQRFQKMRHWGETAKMQPGFEPPLVLWVYSRSQFSQYLWILLLLVFYTLHSRLIVWFSSSAPKFSEIKCPKAVGICVSLGSEYGLGCPLLLDGGNVLPEKMAKRSQEKARTGESGGREASCSGHCRKWWSLAYSYYGMRRHFWKLTGTPWMLDKELYLI